MVLCALDRLLRLDGKGGVSPPRRLATRKQSEQPVSYTSVGAGGVQTVIRLLRPRLPPAPKTDKYQWERRAHSLFAFCALSERGGGRWPDSTPPSTASYAVPQHALLRVVACCGPRRRSTGERAKPAQLRNPLLPRVAQGHRPERRHSRLYQGLDLITHTSVEHERFQ